MKVEIWYKPNRPLIGEEFDNIINQHFSDGLLTLEEDVEGYEVYHTINVTDIWKLKATEKDEEDEE